MRPPVHHSQIPVKTPIPLERLCYLAGSIHALGPRSLFKLFRELDSGADLHERLERYARLTAYRDFIRNRGGDLLPPGASSRVGTNERPRAPIPS
jgi:hypothetical protein